MATSTTTQRLLKGGEFLLETCQAGQVFTPAGITDDQKLIGQTAEEFVRNEVLPHVAELEEHKEGLMASLVRNTGRVVTTAPAA